jgi:uncharacterized protein
MFLRVILIFLLLPLTVLADDLPQPQSATISDFAEVLSKSDEDKLRSLLAEIKADTGVDIVVVTMDRISNYGGWGHTVESYATLLFGAWEIGDAQKNDGILILVATGLKEMRIELGSGYSWAYNPRAKDVIETAMLPRFRAGQTAKGILDGVAATKERVVQPHIEGKNIGLDDHWGTILVIAGGLVVLFFAARAVWIIYHTCPNCGDRGLSRWNEVTDHATSYSSGQGITHLSCSYCDYLEDRAYTISRRADRRSGFSSGSGGGSSGGGSGRGASGKW